MTHRELLYISTVIEEGTILAAAEKLHISQPSLSQAITRIEKSLGMELFLRNGKHIIPTSAGMFIAQQSRELLNQWAQFEDRVAVFAKNHQKEISVGMPSGLCRVLEPYLAAEIRRLHPELSVSFVEERSNTVEQMIMEGKLDLGILHSPLVNQNIGQVPLFKTTNYLAVSKCNGFCKTHPYYGMDKLTEVSLSEVKDIPFVLMHHHKEDVLCTEILSSYGFTPNVIQTTSIWVNVMDYIKHGNCAGLIDEMTANHDMNDDLVAYYRLNTHHHRTTYAVHHPRRTLTQEEYAIIECAKSYPRLIHEKIIRK